MNLMKVEDIIRGFHSYFDWDYNSIEIYDEKVFAHFNNVHQACFLISKKQLKKICGMHDFTNFMSIKINIVLSVKLIRIFMRIVGSRN